MDKNLTPPLRAGQVTLGTREADITPFEIATADFSRINEYLAKNPAYQKHVIPDAYINSCSECCMEEINGRPNILGMLFRRSRGSQGCRFCPVALASEKLPCRKADGTFLKDKNGRVLSEADMIRMAMDGET